MATLTDVLIAQSPGVGLRTSTKHGMQYSQITVDISKFASPPDSGDVISLLEVPIGAEIVSVVCDITTAFSEACTTDIGITGGVADCFFNNLDMVASTGKNFPVCTNEADKFILVLSGHPTGAERTIAMLLNSGTNIASGIAVVHVWLRSHLG